MDSAVQEDPSEGAEGTVLVSHVEERGFPRREIEKKLRKMIPCPQFGIFLDL